MEAMLLLIRKEPAALLRVPMWIAAGRATLKEQVARRVTVDVSLLPYRPDIIELVRARKRLAERSSGDRVAPIRCRAGGKPCPADSMKSSPAEMAQTSRERPN